MSEARPTASRTSCLMLIAVVLVPCIVVAVMLQSSCDVLLANDPSVWSPDPALALALETALVPGRLPPTQAMPGYPDDECVELEIDFPWAEFERRLRSVPGWDIIVVLAPYNSGRDLDLRAAGIEGSALERQVRALRGWPNDWTYEVTVIRDGRIVSGFYVYVNAFWRSGVIRR